MFIKRFSRTDSCSSEDFEVINSFSKEYFELTDSCSEGDFEARDSCSSRDMAGPIYVHQEILKQIFCRE
jgi:hypothetical protein